MSRRRRPYRFVSRPTLVLAVTAAVVLASRVGESAAAEQATSRASVFARLDDWLDAERSVTAAPAYYGEVFSNTRGGRSTKGATKYLGLLDVPVTLNLEKLPRPLPGKIFLLGQNTHGRAITEEYVGDAQVLSNIDSLRNIAQVSEYWWEVRPFGEDVTFRLGKQDLNTEFLFMDLADDFIQSTFGLSPSTAFPTYPNQSAGAVVLVQLAESWQLKSGIWSAFASGRTWGFPDGDSILAITEVEHAYALGDGELPGVASVGAIYESAGEINGDPISAVQEYYVQLEQWILRESPADDAPPQGVGIFAGFYPRIPGRFKTTDSPGDSYVAGATFAGLIPSRDHDVLGVGLAWTELFAGGTGRESAWELFYKIHATPQISLQPDLQYIASPSGIERDALVVGVRFQAAW